MIERHLAEQVMDYMSVRDVVVKMVQYAVIPIDSGKSSTEPIPLRGSVVWEYRIGMLKIRYQHQKKIRDQIWDTIHSKDSDCGSA